MDDTDKPAVPAGIGCPGETGFGFLAAASVSYLDAKFRVLRRRDSGPVTARVLDNVTRPKRARRGGPEPLKCCACALSFLLPSFSPGLGRHSTTSSRNASFPSSLSFSLSNTMPKNTQNSNSASRHSLRRNQVSPLFPLSYLAY
jgi:hypothetical protein